MITWKTTSTSSTEKAQNIIDSILQEYNLRKEDFSKYLDIDIKTLKTYYKHPEKISIKFLDKLCKTFSKNISDIIQFQPEEKEKIKLNIPDEIQKSIINLKDVRNSYINAFKLYSDKRNEKLSESVLKTIHKPLLLLIGSPEANIEQFTSFILDQKISKTNIPVYYIEKNDLPKQWQEYSKIAVNVTENKKFDIRLINNEEYIKKYAWISYKPDEFVKPQYRNYVLIHAIDSNNTPLLKNFTILLLPNLLYENQFEKKRKPFKCLSNKSISDVIKHEQLYDDSYILYFEIIPNFFTLERSPIVQYLYERRLRNNPSLSTIMFIAINLYDGTEKNPIQKIKESGFCDDDNIPKNDLKVGLQQFYNKTLSFDLDYITNIDKVYYNKENQKEYLYSKNKILNHIEDLDSNYHNIEKILKYIINYFNDFSIKISKDYFYTTKESDIREIINQNLNGESSSVISPEQEDFKKDFEIILNKKNISQYIKSMKDKEECLMRIQTLASNIWNNSQISLNDYGCSMNKYAPKFQFIINNILIPYFLVEPTFARGTPETWIKKIEDKLEKFKKEKLSDLLNLGV